MGMYTEFHFNSILKKDVPKDIIKILDYMITPSNNIPHLPDHKLFETRSWNMMLRSDSNYFDGDTLSTLRLDDIDNSYYLCIRCNVKNYDSEIGLFIDWIMPYLDKVKGDFLGFYRYEETEIPTLIYMK